MSTPAISPLPPPSAGPAAPHAQALRDWAAGQDPASPRLCLLHGGPGSGKSHLLAWLLAASRTDPGLVIHATAPAAGQFTQTLAWEIGRQLGYGPCTPAQLLSRIGDDPRPVLIVLPDLHKAGRGPADLPAARAETVVQELIRPLLELPHLRLAAEVGDSDLLAAPAAEALVLELGPEPFQPPAPPRTPEPVRTPIATWQSASAELCEHALDDTLADAGAEAAAELLKDPGFLVHGSPTAITAALADDRLPVPATLRTVWQQAAPALTSADMTPAERAAVLHTACLGVDERLAEYLRPLARTHCWSARWSLPGQPAEALALLPGRSRGDFLLADRAGRVEQRRAADGSLVKRVVTPPAVRPVTLAALRADWALALEGQGILRPLPLGDADQSPIEADYLGLHHSAGALAAPSQQPTALADARGWVALGDAEGGVHLWDLNRLKDGARRARPHPTAITALACAELPLIDGALVVSGALDGAVRLWDSVTGEVMPFPIEQRPAVPTALALARSQGRLVLAVAWSDRQLHLWQVFAGQMAALPLLSDVLALALTPDGRLLLGGPGGTAALTLTLDKLWTATDPAPPPATS